MNPRSDVDFSSPKVDLTVNLSEVAIELNRLQVGVCFWEQNRKKQRCLDKQGERRRMLDLKGESVKKCLRDERCTSVSA